MPEDAADVVVAGAGAAGLATAILTARGAPDARVVVLDGARRLGAKILVSGGGRCNVTNREVSAADYWGGDHRVIAAVLRAFPASRTVAFFRDLGVPLHEEERGKLFPDSNRARTVLDALLCELERLKVEVRAGAPVTGVARGDRTDVPRRSTPSRASAAPPEPAAESDCLAIPAWRVSTTSGTISARRVVLATGGLSVPRTGSDGRGLAMAGSLGHAIVPTTPALVPLLLDGDFHRALSGVSHEASMTVLAGARPVIRLRGPLLWTHFGISGPLALDASRHWLRVRLEEASAAARLSFVPELDFAGVDAALQGLDGAATARPGTLRNLLARWLPAAVVDALLGALGLEERRLAHLGREERRRVAHALTAFELPITGSRGYNYAEATAGGIALGEVDRRTMESTRHAGLYLVGEMLDVDGRLGGFNFQWAWSSAFVAAQAIARALGRRSSNQ